ncbi:MAG: M20/M25/M40 family metallo-hydrolase [Anaerolineaceae bacterium]|nr:M20/M25/M40 family metallo-hydrolase [Anaerolineaceae bacterium]
MNYQGYDQYIDHHCSDSIDELSILCAQPSISATQEGLEECALLLGEMLKKRGFLVEIAPTSGAPVVFAECKGKNTGKTLLFYNHYDVQPAEPLALWHTPPFTPTLIDGKLYGRGVDDDKGNIVSRLFALDAILDQDGELPCNVKFIIEGEEEVSSPYLHEFIEQYQDRIQADACVWECGGVDDDGVPMQALGLRGILYLELSVKTANRDIHSGIGGSIFQNAAWRLTWALSAVKGVDEKVNIPGFYDDILSPTDEDLFYLKKMADPSEKYKALFDLKDYLHYVESGVEDIRVAAVFRPTCTIDGINSGYQGPGSKTIIPAEASAKLEFRLVPDMDPEKIMISLRKYLDELGFTDVEIKELGSGKAAKTPVSDPFVQMVVDSTKELYGSAMQIVPMIGGSGPNAIIQDALKLPIVMAGVGYDGAQVHSPNENLVIDLYLKGTKHIVRILKEFSEMD